MKNLFSISFIIGLVIFCESCSNTPTHSENELLLVQVLDVLAEQKPGASFTGSFRYPASKDYAGRPVYKKVPRLFLSTTTIRSKSGGNGSKN